MSRKVLLPPNENPSPEGIRAGGWWHDAEDGTRIICDLCPRACRMGPEDRGFCFVRQNLGGRMVSTTYGRSTGFCIDPIEKKPLNQFYPGSSVLSFGTAGCNLGCKFCQNWTSSKSREVDAFCDVADPESIAEAALQHHCHSVAFTYNDPIVWAEYAIDTARACHDRAVKTVAVTSGYMAPAARETFYRVMDAANVDLKGFSEDFYWKLTSGHLDPVLDTLRWLTRETDVWVEITNLVIPGANDSDDEIRRMCQWIAEELGPDVPLHFSAFHPDFHMRDRGPTPPATLARAYEFARHAGLRYVYTGNVSDRSRQSTYCPSCGRLVIQRDGYTLGEYALQQDRCRHCGAQVAGRFDPSPGDWGSRRLPIRIAAPAARSKPSQPTPGGESRMEDQSTRGTPPQASERPKLTADQEAAIFRTAGRRVGAAVRCRAPEPPDPLLVPIASMPLLGAFVTLKRAGQLRSCCGFLGQSVPLSQALEHASVRAAKDDPRFPPIASSELGQLHMDVWLLWGLEPVQERGEDRVRAVEIGKHGLQIARGGARGLLLPGVAIEHHLDAREFLRHVCLKAGLPPEAWRDDDTVLMRFEGYAIEGPLDPGPTPDDEPCDGGPRPAEVAALVEFAQQNLTALAVGATPSYYLSGGFDGGVQGLALSARLPGADETILCSRLNLLSDMPLQATLFEMVQTLASALATRRLAPQAYHALRVNLSVFWDATLRGTVAEPKLEGIDARRRAVVVSDRPRWSLVYDPQQAVQESFKLAVEQFHVPGTSQAHVYSMAVATSEPRVVASNVPRPQSGPAERPPAVAGRFYPGNAAEIDRMLDDFLPPSSNEPWAAALVPHAGWIFSGRLAARVLSRVRIPSRVIVIAPKHGAQGADWAVAPYQAWRLPNARLEADQELAQRLAASVSGLELDATAHQPEHAIEVQLPILARLAPQAKLVGIVLGRADWPQLQRFAEQLADVLRDLPERPLLVVSSDMSHEQNRESNEAYVRRMDRLAVDAMKTLDPAQLYQTVAAKGITMCGFRPAVLAMETLRRLGSLSRCEEVGYATSADSPSGRPDYVVGYAGMLFA